MTDRSGIICAGNWIVDIIHDLDRWPNESELVRIGTQARGVGGGPANVITTLAKLETGLPLYPMASSAANANQVEKTATKPVPFGAPLPP